MTPMRANSDDKIADRQGESSPGQLNLVGGTAAESRSGEHSVFKVPAEGILSSTAAMRLDGSAIEGTVGAAVGPVDEDSYSSGSAALLSGELLGRRPSVPARTRANDLLAELREISGQVNRMMSQVDRAIHRLGVHAGEPLRR
jgi:hypothetical protein